MIHIDKKRAEEAKKIMAKLILTSYAFNIHTLLLLAYLNNGKVTINIAIYNEMWIELLIIPLLTIWSLYQLFKRR